MIWYSIVPEEMLWQFAPPAEPIPLKEIRLGGVLMEVELLGEEQARIVRLLDCELHHYLNPDYAPGRMIRYIPTLENDSKG
ncbi:YlzJ-like family protein [Paenibacillus campinasensis]|uniref:YlzJ-like protein n=1 Tax=Paenibacillus campinasensis TaxID=66347 RepID=A0A268ES11_9BACL|nr:YlzJ-like family protein [Paenibacillus campinasensis]PAD75922.1 hypothetical protein CHH67_13335 [Paenibacillus campinasensis]